MLGHTETKTSCSKTFLKVIKAILGKFQIISNTNLPRFCAVPFHTICTLFPLLPYLQPFSSAKILEKSWHIKMDIRAVARGGDNISAFKWPENRLYKQCVVLAAQFPGSSCTLTNTSLFRTVCYCY
jgi:hypothetical protein